MCGKLETYWKNWKSFRRLGNVMCGSERKSRISSANGINLYWQPATVTPWISSFARRWCKEGSNVSMKSNRDKLQPCHVPLLMEEAFDRWPLTRTFAVGLADRAIIKRVKRLPKPISCKTAINESQASWSNALSMSNDKKKPSCLEFVSQWWMFNDFRVLSLDLLPACPTQILSIRELTTCLLIFWQRF